MKKLLEIIRNQHHAIYRIFLFIIAICLGVYLMPKKKSFEYELIQGKPWPHENLISDMEFSILKSDVAINAEKTNVKNNTKQFYDFREDLKEESKKNLDYELSRFLEAKKKDKPSLRSEKEHSNYIKRLEQKTYRLWNKIYSKGLIENNGKIEGKPANYLIKVAYGNDIKSKYLNDFYTIGQATELIRSLDVKDESDQKELVDLLIESIEKNVLFDSGATSEKQTTELNDIVRFSGVVEVGELIISKGEVVNANKYLKLRSYKMEYEDKQISQRSNRFIIAGQLILVSLCFLILFLFIKKNRIKIFRDVSALRFLLLNIILILALARFTQIFPNKYLIYVVPFCVLPLIIRSFYDVRLALFVHTIAIVLVGLLAPDPFHFVFIQLMAGILAVLTIENLYKRSDLFVSAAKIAAIYFLTFLGISLITKGDLGDQNYLVYGFLLISAFLTLFTYPLVYVFEKIFGLVSDISLLELSDTNHPLLKELAEKAPGTFQHSLQVSNLAESAVMEVGGNVLLVRAGALYHDIGKMESPLYFIENQMAGMNPHDELSFDESARIIIGHVIKGVEKAKKYNIPDQVIDFIRTHHGDSMVQYFYRQYIKKFPEKINETNLFCYPGPKPFSKETAVLMMADAVEAASRSLPEKNMNSISDLVGRLIDGQMSSGQFDNASITLKEISIIKKIFIKKLINIHHLRIEYPSA
jgi:putative nucleotidyltransferase with HDIG domain